MIAFDVQPIEGRLPQSSYTEGDSLFTWTDITGIYNVGLCITLVCMCCMFACEYIHICVYTSTILLYIGVCKLSLFFLVHMLCIF